MSLSPYPYPYPHYLPILFHTIFSPAPVPLGLEKSVALTDGKQSQLRQTLTEQCYPLFPV